MRVDATPRDADEDADEGTMEALIAMRDIVKAKFDEVRASTRRAKWRRGEREREERRDEFGDWRLTESSTRRGRWMSRAQMPKHVRVFAMWFIFRMIGAVIRSFFSKPPAPVEKKRVVECETAEAFAEVGRGQGGEAAGGGGFHGDVVWTVSESGADLRGHV